MLVIKSCYMYIFVYLLFCVVIYMYLKCCCYITVVCIMMSKLFLSRCSLYYKIYPVHCCRRKDSKPKIITTVSILVCYYIDANLLHLILLHCKMYYYLLGRSWVTHLLHSILLRCKMYYYFEKRLHGHLSCKQQSIIVLVFWYTLKNHVYVVLYDPDSNRKFHVNISVKHICCKCTQIDKYMGILGLGKCDLMSQVTLL